MRRKPLVTKPPSRRRRPSSPRSAAPNRELRSRLADYGEAPGQDSERDWDVGRKRPQ